MRVEHLLYVFYSVLVEVNLGLLKVRFGLIFFLEFFFFIEKSLSFRISTAKFARQKGLVLFSPFELPTYTSAANCRILH